MLSNFFDRGRCDTRSAFSSVLFQLISFVYKLHLLFYMYFCIIYNYLYNLLLCLICMEMKLMDNKILLNLEHNTTHSSVLK